MGRPRLWRPLGRLFGDSVLTARHTGGVEVHGDGPVAVVTGVVHGSVIVGSARYVVEDAPLTPAPIPAEASGAPSRLLAARHEVARFVGRAEELAALTAWRDEPRHPRAVRLLHGPGGQGKTRLAAMFAQLSAEAGWQVVHARQDTTVGHSAGSPAPTIDPHVERGLLVVIDYAERWPPSHLLAVLGNRLLHRTGLVRLLLLARPAGSWWQGLRHELVKSGVEASTLALDPVADDPDERITLFGTAVSAFATALGVVDAGAVNPPDLSTDAWQLVLTVHMAALAGVDAVARGISPPTSPERLSAYLLDREHAYWQALHQSGRISTTPMAMARAAYTATMTRPLPRDVAVTILDRVGLDAAGQSVDDHGVCYPPSDPDTVFEPLYPDRLGEDFLALSTPGHQVAGYTPDPWAATAAAQLLTQVGAGQPPAWARTAVNVLVETARRWPHIATGQVYPLLRNHPQLAAASDGVYGRIAACHPSTHGSDLAVALTDLATDLLNLGREEEALAARTDVVAVYRGLAKTEFATFGPDLAVALTDLSADLWEMRRRTEAVAANQNAVDIRRRLVAETTAGSEPDLAVALVNLGLKLATLPRRREALATMTEAIDVYQRLTTVDLVAYEPGLARTLWSTASLLADGQADLPLALTTIQESVGRLEHLAHQQPHEFTTDLRGALAAMADVHKKLGHRHQEAGVRRRIEALDDRATR